MTGRSVYLTAADLDALRETLTYSIRNVEDWHARNGSSETAAVGRAKVDSLAALKRKLTGRTGA